MAYMRGRYYIFTSGGSPKDSRVHLWVARSEPRLKESGWAESYGVDRVAGASLPEAVLDELVVMRYAQLEEENRVEPAVQRALRKHGGNVGCDALCRKYGQRTSVERLTSREPQKETRS